MKFKDDRPFATPEAAERKLLELTNAIEADHAGRLSVEIINRQFRDAGGSYEEYGAAVKAAIAHGWITMHPSGAYLSFTQEGADLFAYRRQFQPQPLGSARLAEMISSFSSSSARIWYSSASLRRLTFKTGSALSRARRRHPSACSLKYDSSIAPLPLQAVLLLRR
jgi:hypothetical protein